MYDEQDRSTEIRERLASVIATAPGVVYEFLLRADGSTSVPYASPAVEELFGLRAEDLAEDAGRLFELIPPGERERVIASIYASRETLLPWHEEFRVLHPTRGLRWADARSVPTARPGGETLWRGFIADVTDRNRAARRLAMQAAVSRVLAESGSLREAAPRIAGAFCEVEGWEFGAVWQVDGRTDTLGCVDLWAAPGVPLGAVVEATRRLRPRKGEGLLGAAWSEGRSVLFDDLAGESRFLCAREAAPAGLRCGLAIPIRLGSTVLGVLDFLGRDARTTDPELLDLLDTIGNQIGQFVARSQSQERVRRVVASAPAVLYSLWVDGGDFRLGWVSDNIREFCGFAPSEVASEWWREHLHPEDRPRVVEASNALDTVDHQVLEFRLRRKDGPWIWVRDEKRVLRDAQGKIHEILGSWSDVTSRRLLEDQFRQSQKMEAVGRLAGGVAHDFNNLLTVILGSADILVAGAADEAKSRKLLGDIRDAGERAASLTRQLLAFSRKQVLEPRIVSLGKIVGGLESMLRRLIGEDVVLHFAAPPSSRKVKVDPAQMEQVVLNLVVNARDAMPEGGKLTIEIHDVDLDATYRETHAYARPGPHVMLSVSDTGAGMEPAVRERIFEPFFTTKEAGRGTGLGLSMVFGIVKQSDGHIEVYSEPGVGTAFKIYLPALLDAGAAVVAEVVEPVPRGGETILLVEDEAAVRRIACLALEAQGYRVLEAVSGAAAIARVETHDGAIDLVVTDVVMPGMSGAQAAKILVEKRPGLKVLFMSGYVDDAVVRHGLVDSNQAFLQKPFSPSTLARKVREVLDRKA